MLIVFDILLLVLKEEVKDSLWIFGNKSSPHTINQTTGDDSKIEPLLDKFGNPGFTTGEEKKFHCKTKVQEVKKTSISLL